MRPRAAEKAAAEAANKESEMAVKDIRPNVAWETAVAMGAGGQGAMGQAFMELDQGRPGQERVRTPRSMQRSSIDARENMGAQAAFARDLGSNLGSSIANREKIKRRDPEDKDLLDWTIGRLTWQLTQERT